MPKRKEPEPTSEKQFKEFVKTAREHDVDETGKEFERAFDAVAQSKSEITKTKRLRPLGQIRRP